MQWGFVKISLAMFGFVQVNKSNTCRENKVMFYQIPKSFTGPTPGSEASKRQSKTMSEFYVVMQSSVTVGRYFVHNIVMFYNVQFSDDVGLPLSLPLLVLHKYQYYTSTARRQSGGMAQGTYTNSAFSGGQEDETDLSNGVETKVQVLKVRYRFWFTATDQNFRDRTAACPPAKLSPSPGPTSLSR